MRGCLKVQSVFEAVVYACVFLVVLHYLLYPLTIIVWSRLYARKHITDDTYMPTVTLIIAAYNEERVIAQKLENSLSLDYPSDRLQVVVVSDGATDRTPEIVAQYARAGVVSLHRPEREGKTSALNRAVAMATGDIVVFSDANNDFNVDAIKMLVRHFADVQVGGVCGLKQIKPAHDRHASRGDGLYWRYEAAIKQAESDVASITGADGEIFAIRRSLYRTINPRVINDDAELTFSLIAQGYRVLYESAAKSFEYASVSIKDDFFVKVRMVAGGFQTIARHKTMLFPPRSAFALMFLLHKTLRWLMPQFLLLVLVGAALLVKQPVFAVLLALQIAFYTLALLGWRMHAQARIPLLLYVPFYFTSMNIAAFYGWLRYLRGSQTAVWRKATR